MLRAVLFQFAATAIVAALAAGVAGVPAMLSALFGGLACTVPNALFALHLALSSRKPQSQLAVLLLGEIFKVGLTIALLALVIVAYRQAVWPALMASVCAVLIVQPVAYAWRRH